MIKIALLGGIHVTQNNWLTETKLTPEIQVLLAYLLLQGHRAHSREILAEVFWSEYSHDKAHRALSTALWRLKRALEPEGVPSGTYLTSTHPTEIGFNHESSYWLDVEVFEHQTNQLSTHSSTAGERSNVDELEKTLELYKGELLEGVYSDWALRERERLRTTYLKSLLYLMQYYADHGTYEKAAAYGQKILSLDPIREDVHREMMRIFIKSGQQPLAARQYEICRLTLAKELGILPMEETQSLHAQIFPEVYRNGFHCISADELSFEHALEQLRQASQAMGLAMQQVQQALQHISKYASTRD